MKIGYNRCRTNPKVVRAHTYNELRLQGCNCIFEDKDKQIYWERCWNSLNDGDELIVSSVLDIADDFQKLLLYLEHIALKRIKFRSLLEPTINTTTSEGERSFQLFIELAEWNRAYPLQAPAIANQLQQHLASPPPIEDKGFEICNGKPVATKRVRRGNQYPQEVQDAVLQEIKTTNKTIIEIAKEFRVSRSACYNWLYKSKWKGNRLGFR